MTFLGIGFGWIWSRMWITYPLQLADTRYEIKNLVIHDLNLTKFVRILLKLTNAVLIRPIAGFILLFFLE